MADLKHLPLAKTETNLATTQTMSNVPSVDAQEQNRKTKIQLAQEAGKLARQAYIKSYIASLPREAYLLDGKERYPRIKWHKIMTTEADKVEARTVAAHLNKV